MGSNPKKMTVVPLVIYALVGAAAQIVGATMSVTGDAFMTALVVWAIVVFVAATKKANAPLGVLLAVVAFAVGNMTTMIFIGHP